MIVKNAWHSIKNWTCIYWQKYGSISAWIFFIFTIVYINWLNFVEFGIESDIYLYYSYAQEYLFNHKLPYSDFSPAYPPGAFLLFLAPMLYVKSILAYKIGFAIMTDFFLAIGAFFIFRKGKALSLILFTVFLWLCQPDVILQRFDAILSVILFFSLLQFTRKEYSLAIISLAVSFYIKFFPIILLPFYIIFLPNNTERIKQLGIFLLVTLLMFLPFILSGATLDGFMYFINFNKDRGIQVESSWVSLIMLIKPLQSNLMAVGRYGGGEFISDFTPLLAKLAFYFSAVYMITLFVVAIAWQIKKRIAQTYLSDSAKNKDGALWIIAFLALAGFMLFNKVFSDQYVLWLVPLVPILIYYYKPKQSILVVLLFIIFLATTKNIWPHNYGALIKRTPEATANLLLRNVALLAMVLYFFTDMCYKLFRKKTQIAMDTKKCIICGAQNTLPFRNKYLKNALLRCQNCGLIFVFPQPKFSEIKKIYDRGYFQNPDVEYVGYEHYLEDGQNIKKTSEKRLKIISKLCPQKGRLLDVGCASGFFLETAEEHGFDPYGVEISPFAAKIAEKKFRGRIFNGTLNQAGFQDNFFDVITMWDFIEHVLNPEKELDSAKKLLKTGGLIALTTPDTGSLTHKIFKEKWMGYKDKEHLYYFSRKNLARLLEDNGFKVIKNKHAGKHITMPMFIRRLGLYSKFFSGALDAIVRNTGAARLSFYINPADTAYIFAKKI